jgi:hypothetical protein
MFAFTNLDQAERWAKLLGLIIGIPVAIVGLFKAIYEIQQSRKQRAAELRWKQANTTKELLNDIHEHGLAKNAVHMLDWCEGQAEYEVSPGHPETISYSDVLASLQRNHMEARDAKEQYVRDCFDWFFFRIDRIEHYIRRDLIDFVDVKAIFKVYAREIAKHKNIYEDFLVFHEYELAKAFFDRYTKTP